MKAKGFINLLVLSAILTMESNVQASSNNQNRANSHKNQEAVFAAG